jgi:RNA recognition motif-containing protein
MKNIFVGNLDFNVSEESIQQVFERYGPVERVHLVRDRDTGQPRGFAFVEMTNDADADRAIAELNGTTLGSRAINVNEARPKTGGPGGGGRSGGFRGRSSGPSRGRREPRW